MGDLGGDKKKLNLNSHMKSGKYIHVQHQTVDSTCVDLEEDKTRGEIIHVFLPSSHSPPCMEYMHVQLPFVLCTCTRMWHDGDLPHAL